MKKKIEKLLEDDGWIIECEFPLEIRHTESNSFATGIAAELVIDSLLNEHQIKGDLSC